MMIFVKSATQDRVARATPGAAADSLDSGEAWRNSAGSMRVLRYVSLLYTGFFFIDPYFRHSTSRWLWFAAFYVVFLALYFAIPYARGRTQANLFLLQFVLAFVYFPFNQSASGAFVYPVVMLAFVMRNTRLYLLILGAQISGIALECWVFHMPIWTGALGIFFCIVLGLSNLAYSRQQQSAYLLQRANDEIEHLAQVAERERIARDLHDLLGHTLTVIAIKSELAHRILPSDPARAQREMVEVEQTARQALAEVREAVTGYRSEGISAETLRARRALAAAGVALQTSVEAIELSPAIANALCLCIREAVTNIVRHAGASQCTIHLHCEQHLLCLAVEDNGKALKAGEGNGLRGMRERVEKLGGELQIAFAEGNGTTLSVRLPFGTDGPAACR